MCPLPVHPTMIPVPEVRLTHVPGEVHPPASVRMPDAQALIAATSTADGARPRVLSRSPQPPRPGARRIGLMGGGDTDPVARRRQLEDRKADFNTKLGELSSAKSTLESNIADEKGKWQIEEKALETRQDGKRRAEALLDQLKQKQQQGETDLQSSIDVQTTEVQGWESEIQRVRQSAEKLGRSVAELEGALRSLESDRRRLEGELDGAERELTRL
jgi:hypothetical protein